MDGIVVRMQSLAGAGTTLNNINFNRAKGSSLTFVDFDKGCNYNTAIGNIAESITFPFSLIDNTSVLTAIYADHGSDGYSNTGNKMLFNICKYAESRGLRSDEAAFYVQNVESSTFTGNKVNNFNNGEIGVSLQLGSVIGSLTASDNEFVVVS